MGKPSRRVFSYNNKNSDNCNICYVHGLGSESKGTLIENGF